MLKRQLISKESLLVSFPIHVCLDFQESIIDLFEIPVAADYNDYRIVFAGLAST